LGFEKENDQWVLQGEGSAPATAFETPHWVALKGSVATRIYGRKGYVGLGDQSRVLLFDRKGRIAEITGYVDLEHLMELIEGFEFTDATSH